MTDMIRDWQSAKFEDVPRDRLEAIARQGRSVYYVDPMTGIVYKEFDGTSDVRWSKFAETDVPACGYCGKAAKDEEVTTTERFGELVNITYKHPVRVCSHCEHSVVDYRKEDAQLEALVTSLGQRVMELEAMLKHISDSQLQGEDRK